jgi:exosome complex RNA-binding protein Csl4
MANHIFAPVANGYIVSCSVCGRTEQTHGTCEICNNQDTLVKFKTMLMCPECYNKEKSLTEQSSLEAAGRVSEMNATLRENQVITEAIKVRTDLFNAATVAIADIKSAIEADASITNKPLKLAEVLMERFEHFKKVSFDLQEQLVEAGNHQKAIQIHLNTLANQLRAEEREKLKIADINYKPNLVKPIKDTVAKIRAPKKGFTQEQLVSAAKEAGVTIVVIQALCISKGITPDVAVTLIKTAQGK